MRVLYGMNGVGMGHAARGQVVVDHLRRRGHTVTITTFGRAAAHLEEAYAEDDGVQVLPVIGFGVVSDGDRVRLGSSFLDNLGRAPTQAVHNATVIGTIVEEVRPDVAICDFEAVAWYAARACGIPVISLDNQNGLHRLEQPPEVKEALGLGYYTARWGIRTKIPGAYHYLVSTLVPLRVRRWRTTRIPAILRQDVLDAERGYGDHLVLYHSTATADWVRSVTDQLPYPVRVYGTDAEGTEGNVTFRPFSETGFVEDLRSARGVIASAGFSLMGEALHLGVPMLAIPLGNQPEQQLNAALLDHAGLGCTASRLTPEAVRAFVSALPYLEETLRLRPREGNQRLYAALNELLDGVERGAPRPSTLAA